MIKETRESKIDLPDAPDSLASAPVKAWSEPVSIDTYLPAEPDIYPAFFEKRVYQGSSGSVYPLPFHERIASEKSPRLWEAVHLENQWIRIMILPELGGRIHVGYDKVAGYDFFYRNNVIKPALVGLAGPWISGGVEFNWPQHHRPATFLPTDVHIEHEASGAVTVWMSDHDPMKRMKGMHGIRVSPDRNVVEARVRLFNRTDEIQTFLWWANVAAAVNDEYQSFFPEDVAYVADHARRALTAFPQADRPYYGVDYPARAREANDDSDRIDWYANIPVPTSYMITDTDDDFFGGYDHGRRAGFVHVADRTVAPGKKQWTWGNSEFGWAWDRNLTDSDGPYVELMAGVYTDNQPDFSYLAPGETKTFSQYWYPISEMGPANHGNLDVALALGVAESVATVTACTTGIVGELSVSIACGGDVLTAAPRVATPGKVASFTFVLPTDVARDDCIVTVRDGDTTIATWQPPVRSAVEPRLAEVPPAPEQIESNDELLLTGQYLQQYRHATRESEPYWKEALTRDAGDARAHLALSALDAERGLYASSESHARAAIERLTRYVPTPRDGEAHYRLGIALERQGNDADARDAFAKARWSAPWRSPATLAMAYIDTRAGRDRDALTLAGEVLNAVGVHGQAVALVAIVSRRLGDTTRAQSLLEAHLKVDALDQWVRDLAGLPTTSDATTLVDVALEYARAASPREALRVLDRASAASKAIALGQVQVAPLIHYHRAAILASLADPEGEEQAIIAARQAPLEYCLPTRPEDIRALGRAVATASDARAFLLLGDWYYQARRYVDAMEAWQKCLAGSVDPLELAMAHRNCAIATFNVAGDHAAAHAHMAQARTHRPRDSRLLYESDQLSQRLAVTSGERLSVLRAEPELVAQRDDLNITMAQLMIDEEQYGEALALLTKRHFQPWEGGEGLALAQWDRVHIRLSLVAHEEGRFDDEVRVIDRAFSPPVSLGEARHPLANTAELDWHRGTALRAAGDHASALEAWERAAASTSDFADMSAIPYGPQTVFSVRALRDLGRLADAAELISSFRGYIASTREAEATIDYFATSLPTMLLFHQHPNDARDQLMDLLESQLESDDIAAIEAQVAEAPSGRSAGADAHAG